MCSHAMTLRPESFGHSGTCRARGYVRQVTCAFVASCAAIKTRGGLQAAVIMLGEKDVLSSAGVQFRQGPLLTCGQHLTTDGRRR